MAVTYDLASTNLTIAATSEIRFEIGDTITNSGVLPDGANFQDDELALLLNRNGGSVLGATASACETLSRRWANYADVQSGDVRKSASQISAQWAKRADKLRAQLGGNVGGSATPTVTSAIAGRTDGYSV